MNLEGKNMFGVVLGFGDKFGWVGALFGLFGKLYELLKTFLNIVWIVLDY